VHCTFRMHGQAFTWQFVVVPGFGGLILLGIDFFRAHGWTKPDPWGDFYVFTGDRMVPFETNPMLPAGDELTVKVPQHVQVPPRSDVTLAARVVAQHGLPEAVDGMFRPAMDLFPRLQVCAPHAITRAYKLQDGHHARLVIRNPTAAPLTLRAGNVIGYFSMDNLARSVNYVDTDMDLNPEPEPGDVDPLDRPYKVDLERIVAGYNLAKPVRDRLLALLTRYRSIFDVELGKPPVNHMGFEVGVDTGNHAPVRARLRKLSPDEDAVIRQEVMLLLKNHIIVPCESPWGAPVLVVPKPGRPGEWGCVTNFREVNDRLRKDVYPLPRTRDLLNLAGGSRVFSTLDAMSGFYSLPVREEDQAKLAMLTKFELFCYTRMPMGLSNSPSIYMRFMDLILGDLRHRRPRPGEAARDARCEHGVAGGQDPDDLYGAGYLPGSAAVVFMDDVLVHSSDMDQHFLDLEEVLRRLHKAGVSMRLDKCSFFQSEVKYLGVLVSGEGTRADPKKLEAIRAYPAPTSAQEIRRALGLFGFYRHFIPGFAELAEPLHELLRGADKKGRQRVEFAWGERQQHGFEELKRRLIDAALLRHPDFDKHFYVHTDASSYAAGAVLVQLDDRGKPRPIAFYSQAFSPAQRKYSATERECLALRLAIAHFREYLGPVTKFTVVTDHAALMYVMTMRDPSPRIARWQMFLSSYNFDVEHRRGKCSREGQHRRGCAVKIAAASGRQQGSSRG
jgi:hypothetical protein